MSAKPGPSLPRNEQKINGRMSGTLQTRPSATGESEDFARCPYTDFTACIESCTFWGEGRLRASNASRVLICCEEGHEVESCIKGGKIRNNPNAHLCGIGSLHQGVRPGCALGIVRKHEDVVSCRAAQLNRRQSSARYHPLGFCFLKYRGTEKPERKYSRT